jgi:bacillithiol system protein YtxJ
MDLTPLTDITQLNDIDFLSGGKKQVIIKHSTRCHISKIILKHVEAELGNAKDPSQFDIYYLDLIKHRDISNAIAERYKVRHESPQLLVIENGKCVYNASHHSVSLDSAGLI